MLTSPLITPQSLQIAATAEDRGRPQFRFAFFASLVASACVVAMLTIIVWGLNKGFDPNVEGFYLLSYQHPELYPTFTSFHLILSKFPKLAANEILSYRLWEVIARTLPSIVLAFATIKSLGNQFSKSQILFTVAFSLLGGLLSYSCFPRTISYNGLTSALVVLSASFALIAIKRLNQGGSKYLSNSLITIAGALIGLAAFVKCTSAATLMIVLLLYAWLKGNAKATPYLILGALIAVTLFFSTLQNPISWMHTFIESASQEAAHSHNIRETLTNTVEFLVSRSIRMGLLVLTAATYIFSMRNASSTNRRIILTAVISACACLVLYLASTAYYLGREAYVPIFALLILLLTVASQLQRRFNISHHAEIVLLVLLPVICTIGTNCSFIEHIASAQAPFFIVISLLLIQIETKFVASAMPLLVAICLCAFSSVQLIDEYVFHRYDTGALTQQSATAPGIERLRGIEVSPPEVTFLQQQSNALKSAGFTDSDRLLCLYDLPGLNYLDGAISPGQAFYVGWEIMDSVNAHYFATAPFPEHSRLFLAISGDSLDGAIWQKLGQAIEGKGCPYPEAFQLIGSFPNPYSPGKKLYLLKSEELSSR